MAQFGIVGATAVQEAEENGTAENGTPVNATPANETPGNATPEDGAPGAETGERPGWLRAREATALIEVFGNYNFPEAIGEGEFGGSGAIIDQSGIALTNAHVVTGADTIRVYAGEDLQQSYNAQILGVSDCVDLAVIDIQGDGFPTLGWRQGEIFSGLEIGAHGFPVGGQTMASSQGVVSRVEGEGETDWASVDSVVEHTATIAPGSSGGPLVDESGDLVGINYAGSLYFPQYYAVGRDVAQPVIEQLRGGENVHYLGMGTMAIETETPMTPDGITRALHVITVDPGSPAWNAGIRSGDRIVRIRDSRAVQPETPFPTKAFYCDVLRTQGDDAVYPVLVFRPLPGGQAGGSLYQGEINGAPLQPVVGEGAEQPEGEYAEFQAVSDDTGTIRTEVPAEWGDVDGEPGSLGAQVIAAPSIDEFWNSWGTPGVIVSVTDQFGADTDAALDHVQLEGCQVGERVPFTGPGLTGQTERLADCEGSGTDNVSVAALTEDESAMALLQVQIVGQRDEAAFTHIVETLQITGEPADVGPGTTPEPEMPGNETDGAGPPAPGNGSTENGTSPPDID